MIRPRDSPPRSQRSAADLTSVVGIDVTVAPQGLTSHEVRARVAAGQVNNVRDTGSRSLASIIRTNTLTWFNALIGTLWVAMMIVAPWQDALFGFVIVFNTLIGTIQEYRSARTLAALSLLNEFRPTVVRDGVATTVGMRELVVDDVVLVSTGDQIAVDGEARRRLGWRSTRACSPGRRIRCSKPSATN